MEARKNVSTYNKWKELKKCEFDNIVSVFSGSNVDQGVQGGRPVALGWFTVSQVPQISELWFFYESI